MELFRKIFNALNKGRVKYMVAGGIAVNLYGIERATADLDIVILLDEKNLLRFVSVANAIGLKPKLPVKLEDFLNKDKRKKWMDEKNMKVFSLFDPKNPFFLIDIMMEYEFDFDRAYKNRKKVRMENTIIPLIPLDVLIQMKEKTGRPQDMADAFYLKKLKEVF